MTYDEIANKIIAQDRVEQSTMMKTPCLRYQGHFMAMMFVEHDALIVKVLPEHVDELIADGKGMAFNFTKKRFKQWVQIPVEFVDEYESYIFEALAYAKTKPK